MAAIEAIKGSQAEPNNMVQEFKKRRDIVVKGLNDIPGIKCAVPQGAFYAFPNIKGTGLTSSDFANKILQEAGVAVLAGESFGRFGSGYIRISYANSTENLVEAIDRIKSFLNS